MILHLSHALVNASLMDIISVEQIQFIVAYKLKALLIFMSRKLHANISLKPLFSNRDRSALKYRAIKMYNFILQYINIFYDTIRFNII